MILTMIARDVPIGALFEVVDIHYGLDGTVTASRPTGRRYRRVPTDALIGSVTAVRLDNGSGTAGLKCQVGESCPVRRVR